MPIGRFIAMVGFLVWRRSDGRYLLLQRSADKDFAPGEWETGSGRLDQGEGFADAVRRESMEELGVEVRIECILGTTHFYRGEPTPDNDMQHGSLQTSNDGLDHEDRSKLSHSPSNAVQRSGIPACCDRSDFTGVYVLQRLGQSSPHSAL